MSTFPLATLASQITAAGISAPSYSDILSSLIASFKAIYGSDAVLTPDAQDYQLLAVFALAINDCNQAAIADYNGFAPTVSQGAFLSALVKINGLQRLIPTNSTAVVNIVGTVGTVIVNGVAQDTSGNLWNLPASVTIPGGGTLPVTVTAQQVGAVAAPAGTITTIYTPVLGWQSVTNPAAAIPGAAVETDAALRIRQQISTGLSAQTPLQAIAAAIANLVGVVRSIVYENPTGSTDANGLPPHSINPVVQGGDVTAIANAIESKKSPGTGTNGGTAIVVNDPAGVPITIKFDVLVFVNVWVSVTIKATAGFVAATATALQAAVVAFINALPIGGTVFYDQVLAIATLITLPTGQTFHVIGMTQGTAPNPSQTADVVIPFNKAAATVTANVVVTTT